MEECIETSIIYYEFMLDTEIANQRIIQDCFIERFNEMHFADESVIIKEALISSVIKFIKEIFNNLVNFFKKIIKTFLNIRSTRLKVNRKLVQACENKIKTMSADDQRNFRISKALYSNNMVTFVKFMNDNNGFVGNVLKKLTDELDKCVSNKDYIPKVSEQDMQSLDEINNSYDKLSNPDTLKIDMVDITFEDINGVLEDYKKSPDSINTVGKSLVESQNVAEDCKKRVDKLVEKPDNASNEVFNQFKNAMYKTANLVIKISKGIIDTSVEMFKNYERILNIFINWGSNTESFYFEDKDILYLL